MALDFITWNVDPVVFTVFGRAVRWYGLMWALGFFLGYQVEDRIYRREKLPEDAVEKFFIYMAISTVIGARLGHCYFYDFSYYISRPLEVLQIWQGGLSSHGGAVGILIGMYIFSKKVTKHSYIWTLDRTVIAVAITGACIRFGNLMNHEIYGHPTDLPWAFRFITNLSQWMRGAEPVYSEPSHPTQIYEILYCLVTFGTCMYLYWKTKARKYEGLIFGVFLIFIFLTRFILEFIKNSQESYEDEMAINVGQILSIPLIILGIFLLARVALGKAPVTEDSEK